MMSRRQAIFELVVAALVWGFGFVATRWALESFGPLWLTTLRFFIVSAIALPFIFVARKKRHHKHLSQFYLAATPGLLLGATLIFQTYGLKYTTITKNSFITCLYVVFVPLFEATFRKQAIRPLHALFVLISLVGTALISQFHGGDWNVGDMLTFACSLCASLHIIAVGVLSEKIESPFQFNVYQSIWAGTIPLFLAVGLEPLSTSAQPLAVIGLLFVAIGSTLIAFMIQVRTQRVLPPSIVSLFFLMESPFAALFAFAIFKEHLGGLQWLGAILIFSAAMGTALFSLPK